MKHFRLISFFLLLPLLFSCTGGASPADTSTAAPPLRVAVLFSSLVEIWQAAGGEVAITVGESVERGLVAADTPLVDRGAGKQIDTERLLAERPDLVVYTPDVPAQAAAAELASKAGIPTLALRIESFADYCEAITMATTFTRDADAFAALNTEICAVNTVLGSAEAASVSGKRILFVRAGQTASSTKAKRAEDHFAATMLKELGLVNIADEAPILLDTLSTEAILSADPEHIFFSLMGDEEGARRNVEALLARPEWQALTAVRNGRVTILPRDLFHFKPCKRWSEAYLYLIRTFREEVTP